MQLDMLTALWPPLPVFNMTTMTWQHPINFVNESNIALHGLNDFNEVIKYLDSDEYMAGISQDFIVWTGIICRQLCQYTASVILQYPSFS